MVDRLKWLYLSVVMMAVGMKLMALNKRGGYLYSLTSGQTSPIGQLYLLPSVMIYS